MQLKPLFPKGTAAFVFVRIDPETKKGKAPGGCAGGFASFLCLWNFRQTAGTSVCFLREKAWTLHSQTTAPSTAQSTAAG